MWSEVLDRLAANARVEFVANPAGSLRREPQVWLNDGHGGPLPVSNPQVVQLHEAAWEVSAEFYEPDFLTSVLGPTREAAARCSAVICPSASSRQQIIDTYGVEADRVFVAHHGIDHAVFRPGVEGGFELVGQHGGKPDMPYVLFVGSVHPRKNLHSLRGAMVELAARGLPHQLVVVAGPAWGRSDHDALAAGAIADLPPPGGPVVGLPFGITDEEVAALMSDAAALCLPSFMEGFGLPVAEAMACACPVVVSDRGALPEVVGEAGIVVEPTVAAISAGLATVLSSPARSSALRHAAVAQAQRYTWDACAAAWLRALEWAIMNPRPPDIPIKATPEDAAATVEHR